MVAETSRTTAELCISHSQCAFRFGGFVHELEELVEIMPEPLLCLPFIPRPIRRQFFYTHTMAQPAGIQPSSCQWGPWHCIAGQGPDLQGRPMKEREFQRMWWHTHFLYSVLITTPRMWVTVSSILPAYVWGIQLFLPLYSHMPPCMYPQIVGIMGTSDTITWTIDYRMCHQTRLHGQ